MFFKQSGLNLPMSQAFIAILKSVISLSSQNEVNYHGVILNFRDPQYTAENGGFHPVEIRLIRCNDGWYFDYLTDFSFIGTVWPELEKEMDISWSQGYVWHYLMGDLEYEEGGALFELWQRNFIQYWKMKIYTVSVQWEC
ncbi:DUF2787 family protein [Escherichia marmotae]|uniref:DUF2787 family protein n=1 Tax=Escherichia marmotae TaxID=1499973 RepID=A0A7H9KDA5_9ESCH|nr:DUF2787 family protein [Escherichia marmotae]EBS2048590.1 DUF2787 domain-containing protein [Salmonella enterica subsp. enterica serovar Poona]ECD4582993.1 DUF2787 domain-containing protein [Salmonella enterica subsp. enterica serovar Newport]EBY5010618.1 DUF2787 domain-containing protein [Salmonella enterica subsp. enterica serovar Poona]EBY9578237.1 DUF2787 domain-containing protein [Salmonella enterica subsp. enterica serovar Poona]ECA5850931.1 DUF2787 domain-containing protein [Salmonel